MSSVTQRIKEVEQKFGGYLNPTLFKELPQGDMHELHPTENVPANIVGLAVDYLARFMTGSTARDSFAVSLTGAVNAEKLGVKDAVSISETLLARIRGIDDLSVDAACKLCSFDRWYKNAACGGTDPAFAHINPDFDTMDNIRIMVGRTKEFIGKYGPVLKNGFSFENPDGGKEQSGYTFTVNAGEGDFLTVDTLWDYKTSRFPINQDMTLQLFMYWIMGKHSGQRIYEPITKVGIYNPRQDTVWQCDLSTLPPKKIRNVEEYVLRYPNGTVSLAGGTVWDGSFRTK